ncbi:MAG: hypothetical protein WD426_00635 [Anditalea sp.]
MKKNVIITVAEQYLNCLGDIADKLRADGLHIKRLYDFGVVVGEIEEKKIDRILTHKEIDSCSEEKKIQLPPPDADEQ